MTTPASTAVEMVTAIPLTLLMLIEAVALQMSMEAVAESNRYDSDSVRYIKFTHGINNKIL